MSVRKIAETLQVSPSTVSLALRNNPKISESTRQKVLQEAERLGYKPNAKLNELMSQLRLTGVNPGQACFGVMSFYDALRPWENSKHLGRIFASMQGRADQLGYRLEPLGLRSPGMTSRRFRSILDARGIEGLLCFGGPNLYEDFPEELDHFAVVTIGLSIRTPLHRVTSHFYNDLYYTLNRVHEMGYRRPGLVLGRYEEDRSAYAYPGAYLGWCEHSFGVPGLMPVLRLDKIEEVPLMEWYRNHRPDVILFVHLYDKLEDLKTVLRRNGVKIPQDVGIAAVTQILEGTGVSGMEQNQGLMGAWSVELLVARIMNRDVGIPKFPRIEMVESNWIEGTTLRKNPH